MKKIRINCIQIVAVVSFILSISVLVGFLHGRNPFHWDGYILDVSAVGQYGDFVGGVIGTFVSTVLLYLTFKLQREESSKNIIVYKTEIQNNLYFQLYKIYKDLVDNIKISDDDSTYYGKEALHYKYEKYRSEFVQDDRSSNLTKQAICSFQDFYSHSRDISPVLFRTIYRILYELDNCEPNIRESAIQLIKILRAQLTDTELVLIRYDCLTKQGKKLAVLVTKFNLLKHLPPLELMEYKKWRDKMNIQEQEHTNELLLLTKWNIVKVLNGEIPVGSYSNNSKKYNINVSANERKTELKICIYMKLDQVIKRTDLIDGICKLDYEERVQLIEYFLKDCLIYSVFNLLNGANLVFTNSGDDNGEKYYFNVINKNGLPIKIR